MNAADRTLAVPVLRGIRWEDSPVFASLRVSGTDLALCIFSNGNATIPSTGGPVVESIDDGSNPGVGPRYLHAARVAHERGDSFLLLLDHDFCAPPGWWASYESAVASHPQSSCWAPRLWKGPVRLSPFALRNGRPRQKAPLPEGLLDARTHVALNCGLLIRVEAVLMAGDELVRAPLDFSDFALFHRLGRSGGTIAPVDLDIQHDSSTHDRADISVRLSRFAWFCQGARAYAELDPAHRRPSRTWSLGRAIKLSALYLDLRFLRVWKKHFLDGSPAGEAV